MRNRHTDVRARFTGFVASALSLALVAIPIMVCWYLYLPITVAGGSMYPALQVGDLVLVRRGGSVHEGDIALMRSRSGGRYLHRVTDVLPGGELVTRGDANGSRDVEPVPRACVEGRVEVTIPIGRILGRWRSGA